eukprot:TRINITY_DN6284_c0_g3_i2.p1 TRINITY_DN6284_c0_g3~~TRINITY_DN6284_c0_g3_i2.p1  ORF type:complete len:273 (+),score=69.66 TRINITY_DN6284_c0_g3_i2:22-819(+)
MTISASVEDQISDSGESDYSVDSDDDEPEIGIDIISDATRATVLTSISSGASDQYSQSIRCFWVPTSFDSESRRELKIRQRYLAIEETGGAVYNSCLALLDAIFDRQAEASAASSTATSATSATATTSASTTATSATATPATAATAAIATEAQTAAEAAPASGQPNCRSKWNDVRFALPNGGVVIELGCGPGLVSTTLALAGARVITSDGCEDTLELCKVNLKENGLLHEVSEEAVPPGKAQGFVWRWGDEASAKKSLRRCKVSV